MTDIERMKEKLRVVQGYDVTPPVALLLEMLVDWVEDHEMEHDEVRQQLNKKGED